MNGPFVSTHRSRHQRYHPKEVCAVHIAAKVTGIPERTIRRWCKDYGIGSRRSIARGPWEVSWPALYMFLANDHVALKAYLGGQRQGSPVAEYYQQAGLWFLLELPEFRDQCGPNLNLSVIAATPAITDATKISYQR